MNNPFSLSFGKTPTQLISRISQTNQILETFGAENPPNQVYMITGIRGSGKTVMMTTISDFLNKDKNWIVVELNPERDMLQSLAASLYSYPGVHSLFIKAKLDLTALGIGVSIENSNQIFDVEIAIDQMLRHIKKSGKKVLITVDEVTKTDNVKVFAASYQILIRKNHPVFLLMTGLYENIYDIQNEKSLTFLYRAPKIALEPLSHNAIKSQYKKIFKVNNDEAGYMAGLTKGYSYAFQVLGYLRWESRESSIDDLIPQYDQYLEEYVYSKIWAELSGKDKQVIRSMSDSGETNVTAIRKSLGMATSEFSVYRDRLKKKGLINTMQYGYISLVLPRFEVFVKGME